MSSHNSSSVKLLKQPKAVWAVAFACVIAFMGIGLVDPILPAISADLGATAAQTMMLFTSYLLVTGFAMFFTSFVSSRIGAKRTLLIGLALIVIFAALAGASDSVGMIIGFRAGWGLGNALFISTALATIVGAASGGADSAIILYEAALGLGIAIGPLLGGALGSISWRGPFFGTAVLMAIALVALLILLGKPAEKPAPVQLSATFKALRHPALLTLGLAALFYNFGFFSLLAWSPFPLAEAAKTAGLNGFGAHQLGLIFCGWGIALAVTSVFVAPVLTRRFGRRRTLYVMLGALAVLMAVLALNVDSLTVLIVGIVVGGLFLGVMNTVLTESVMEATELPRAVASSTYSGVRFVGGAVAPALAGVIAAALGSGAPYWVGCAGLLIAVAILWIGRGQLARIDTHLTEEPSDEALALTAADA
ncbi:putative major facilitator superfamily transporter [Microlunatus phosphovorus NM-1]|uniref:Putative major facilitator superfamily transporter n=1 Tax=Microlunatus phosphovorus (strain ATCC 700054 / DSM 10555 / JCM 9379 / NBRC 101784 / NCIMB 13414 / VKM Ac-1990 / NM-1) TaxID=1032480 RepID=F5XPL8_MICPN|nr:putative major facilitator superfamily transporter [Microlunatus phosphovorus NM-1]